MCVVLFIGTFALIFTHPRGVPRVLMGVARCWRGGKHGRRESLPSCATCSFLHAQNPANTNPSQGEGALRTTRGRPFHARSAGLRVAPLTILLACQNDKGALIHRFAMCAIFASQKCSCLSQRLTSESDFESICKVATT